MDAPAPQPNPSADAAGHSATLGSAVRVTALVTLASRFGGLARDMLVGLMFRDTALGSAFAFAFAAPNLFRRLFGEGALSAAFIPQYTRELKADAAAASRLASLTLVWLGLVTSAITIVIEIILLILLLALPHDEDRNTAIALLMVMLPFMPFICCAAIMAGMLQVHGRFGPASAGPLLLNGFIIAVGLYFVLTKQAAGPTAAYAIGVATTLSGLTQALWFARLLRPHVAWTRDTAAARPAGKVMLAKFVPVMLGAGTLQLNTFLDNLIATYSIWVGPTILGITYPLDDRSGSIVSLTSRLYQFPLGVFGLAVAAAVFPMLARFADEAVAFISTLRRGVRLSLFISLPATIGLILVRHDATAALAPTFSPEGQARCAAVLLGFAPGVWAYSVNHVFTRAFYARHDTATPMKIALAMLGLNIALNLSLIWPMHEAGLAWSTSISAMVQTLVLAQMLRRKGVVTEPILDRDVTGAIIRMSAACAAMAGAVLALQQFWPAGETHRAWWLIVARLATCTAVGGVIYLAIARLLRWNELAWLISRAKPQSKKTDTMPPDSPSA